MGATDSITLNRILAAAASLHASDLHFLVGSQPVIRVDGKLTAMSDEPIVAPEFMESIVATFLNEAQMQELAAQKELVAAASLNAQLRFKIRAFYQRGALAASIHFIGSSVKKIADLGLPEVVGKFPDLTKGLVLLTGPYGSGRTTTMNAIVNEINQRRSVNIVTVEQPIEYLFVNNQSIIEQREVGRDALSYEQAITAASREDVDVIVIAEAERPEVIAAMLEAAESSRLVISTMNTESAMGTIEKILTSVPPDAAAKTRVQLANVLVAIVSQRLLPRAGGGLVPIAEIMIPGPAVRSVIRDGQLFQLRNVIQSSGEPGSVALDRALADAVRANIISLADAQVQAEDPANLERSVKT